jgi:hypothetical protein
VKGSKQQSWKDLQARHQQIPNRLSAAQVRIIGLCENRRDLGHVPQLFHHALVAPLEDSRLCYVNLEVLAYRWT